MSTQRRTGRAIVTISVVAASMMPITSGLTPVNPNPVNAGGKDARVLAGAEVESGNVVQDDFDWCKIVPTCPPQ